MKTIAYSLALIIGISTAACGGSSPSDEGASSAQPGNGDGVDGQGPTEDAPGWHTLDPLQGGARQEAAVLPMNGLVAVIGGFDMVGEVVSSIEVYDPTTRRWDIAQPLPEPRHHVNAAVVAGNLYVLGSLEGPAFIERGETHVFYTASGNWASIAPMPPGTERGASAVGVLGSTIYVAGGLRGGASVADFSSYNVDTDTWSELPPMPDARDHLVGGVIGNIFYAIGGRKDGVENLAGDVYAFDPAAGAWSTRAPMPTPRGGAAGGILGDRIFVVGGEGNPGAESGVFDATEVYDPAKDAWTTLEPMLTPRHGTGAAGIDGVLYIPGGATKKLLGAVATFEAYIPE